MIIYTIVGVSRSRMDNEYIRRVCDRQKVSFVSSVEDKEEDRYYLYFIKIKSNYLSDPIVAEMFGEDFTIHRRHTMNTEDLIKQGLYVINQLDI